MTDIPTDPPVYDALAQAKELLRSVRQLKKRVEELAAKL